MKKIFDLLILMEYGLKYSATNHILFKEASDYMVDVINGLIEDYSKGVFTVDGGTMGKLDRLRSRACKSRLLNCERESMLSDMGVINDIRDILFNQTAKDRLSSDDFYVDHKIERNFNFHQKTCEEIFHRIKDPGKTFWVQVDHYDGDIDDENGGDVGSEHSVDFIRLSVLSEDALEYDKFIFGALNERENASDELRSIIQETYKPYFIEFYIDVEKLNHKHEELLRTVISNHEGWFEARFISDEGKKTDDSRQFDGVYAHSASPVIYEHKILQIVNNQGKKINVPSLPKNYLSDDKQIKEKLKSLFSGVVFNRVRIYKTGNGNCIYSYGSDGKKEKRLLYDIGIDNQVAVKAAIGKMPYSYQPSIRSIRKFAPSCLILSHWDADHYKACVYGGKSIFDCTWIAPDLKDASINAKRLGAYLYSMGKMMFVDRSAGREIKVDLTDCSTLTLYIGNYARDLSRANCEGIAIKHENRYPRVAGKKIRCLMQGDVSYKSLPQEADFEAETPYEYLVAPHHGSSMNLTYFRSCQGGIAVICCTDNKNWSKVKNKKKNKKKNRPTEDHRTWLKTYYSRVMMTENVNRYIQFNLRLKNSVITK